MTRKDELIDELLKGCKDPEDLFGKECLLKQLTKSLMERALEGELTDHLGYPKHSPVGKNTGNSRNGKGRKTLKGDLGEIPIEVARDREGSFDPQIIKKRQTRFDGFDDKIVAMYARGMTTRDIQAQLEDIYGVEVSATLISNVTDEIHSEVKAWQNRTLDPQYPIVYLDVIRIKARSEGQMANKAVYLAVGITMDGLKEVLGMWLSPLGTTPRGITKTEGAKFWLSVLTELKNCGLRDILIASVDGLKGFPEAIEVVYPQTQVQLCIVHLVRHSLKYFSCPGGTPLEETA